jgi:hypothetical protein
VCLGKVVGRTHEHTKFDDFPVWEPCNRVSPITRSLDLGYKKKAASIRGGLVTNAVKGIRKNNPGSDLLSHTPAHAVPSAVAGLTSVFGMGTGGTLPL